MLLLFGLEMGSRAYWTLGKQVPFLGTRHIWKTFFPEVNASHVELAPCDHHTRTFHVLILGPSVWHPSYGGDMAEQLQNRLQEHLGRPVRVYNASSPGRTSRDALVVYRHLANHRFDLVLFYHGINDAFLNNCPSSWFKNDYSHATRFKNLRLLDQEPEHTWFAFPYTIRYHFNRWCEQLKLTSEPNLKWSDEGKNVKSAAAFRGNVKAILALARQRGDRVLLSTFAYYVPAGYSKEACLAHKLDYDRHLAPVEHWGSPEGVTRCVNIQNDIIRDLAGQAPGVVLVDLARLMPTGKGYFDDPCHLTPTGRERMVSLLLQHVDWKSLSGSAGHLASLPDH
jgi:hypothetical protein